MAQRRIHYGHRARIGIILPSVNVAAEPQFLAMAPPGVAVHVTRLPLRGSSEAELRAMAENVELAARLLADAEVDVVAFHCTAVTTFAPGADDDIMRRIEGASGIRASATSAAVLAALRALGARRVVLLTPYVEAVNRREAAFLEDKGLAVAGMAGMGIADGMGMYAVEPEHWIDYARAHRDDAADAYFLSCAAVRTAEVIETLEAELARPVISSNQAGFWHYLRLCGIQDRVDGFGSLFRR